MYLPKFFEEKNHERIIDLIREYPFATLISVHSGEPCINHLPLIFENLPSGKIKLVGHMARSNPQADLLPESGEVTVVFHGPNSYISPSWYSSRDGVPTWNYATVHLRGKIAWIKEFAPLVSVLKKMTAKFEGESENSWKFSLPENLSNEKSITQAIIGFEIKVETVQAKFKLSQNRSSEDREGVLKGLQQKTDEISQQVLRLIRDVSSGDEWNKE